MRPPSTVSDALTVRTVLPSTVKESCCAVQMKPLMREGERQPRRKSELMPYSLCVILLVSICRDSFATVRVVVDVALPVVVVLSEI